MAPNNQLNKNNKTVAQPDSKAHLDNPSSPVSQGGQDGKSSSVPQSRPNQMEVDDPMDVAQESSSSKAIAYDNNRGNAGSATDAIQENSSSSSDVPVQSATLANASVVVDSMKNFSAASTVPRDFASSVTSDQRMKLQNEIERLKYEVFKATIGSIGCPQGSIVPSNLNVLTNQLETAQKTYHLVFSNMESTLVPTETPYFQWKGHHFNKRRPTFATPNDCLDHFELVLNSHRLPIEENWARIVPAKLSTGMARWYANLIARQGRLSWSQFRNALINKYGKSIVDMRDEAREQLEQLLYQHSQPFDKFIERFQQLRHQAEIQDEDCIVRYLIKSLPEELADHTRFYLNTNAERNMITVDFAVGKVVAIYNGLFKKKWEKQQQQQAKRSLHSSSNISTSHSSNKRCIYHPNANSHTTADCKASDSLKQRIDVAQKKFGNKNSRICHYCKETGWTPAHKLVCKKRSGSKPVRAERRSIVPIPAEVEVASDGDNNMDTDNESEEQNMIFAAMNIKD